MFVFSLQRGYELAAALMGIHGGNGTLLESYLGCG